MRMPTPVFMADIARAMQTPPPPAASQPAPTTIEDAQMQALKKAQKNERDRLRRKEKRAADLKAAKAVAKKESAAVRHARQKNPRKAKKKKALPQRALTTIAVPAKRGRGRPPGSKNKRGRPPGAKNKATLLRAAAHPIPAPDNSLLAQISSVVLLLNAMPEHARKVVLDAVK